MYCVTKLQLTLVNMLCDGHITMHDARFVPTYGDDQRDAIRTVLDMLTPVKVEGAIYPTLGKEDVDVAIALLKEAGINI